MSLSTVRLLNSHCPSLLCHAELTYTNDIALIELDCVVRGVRYALLPRLALAAGSRVSVAGWGSTEGKNAVNAVTHQSSPVVMKVDGELKIVEKGNSDNRNMTLHSADLRTVALDECKRRHGSGAIDDSMLCATSDTGDTCQGDSGGPLVYKVSNEHYLYGITSWGYVFERALLRSLLFAQDRLWHGRSVGRLRKRAQVHQLDPLVYGRRCRLGETLWD